MSVPISSPTCAQRSPGTARAPSAMPGHARDRAGGGPVDGSHARAKKGQPASKGPAVSKAAPTPRFWFPILVPALSRSRESGNEIIVRAHQLAHVRPALAGHGARAVRHEPRHWSTVLARARARELDRSAGFRELELSERLAAMTPGPETNLLICHGLLAPRARWRARAATGREYAPA